ncbi:MAG: polysaccharide biosynthesis tyrosine autokinase [Bryobacterales bacterium]|nr:polysaccharide biosynthesis tyrosine autokinase [Bryobacterales bacterium]
MSRLPARHYTDIISQGDSRAFLNGSMGNQEEHDTINWADMFLRHKFALVAATVICAAGAFWASTMATPVYSGKAVIEIENENDDVLNVKGGQPAADDQSYLQTQVDILSSKSLLRRVSERLHLEQQFHQQPQPAHSGRFDSLFHQAPLTPGEQALGLLQQNLQIKAPQGASRLVTISYDADNPEFAAKVANTIAEEFIEQNFELRLAGYKRTGQWVDQQLRELKQKLAGPEEQLQAFTTASGLTTLGTDRETVAEAKLRQYQEDLSKAQSDRIDKEAHYDLIKSSPPSAVAELLDNGPLRDYEAKLADTERQLAELRAVYTPNHYKVKEAEAQVASLTHTMDTERQNILNRANNEYNAALRREQLLSAAFAAQLKVVSTQAADGARYSLLKSDVDAHRQMYDTMLQKAQGLQVTSALRSANIAVVDSAEPPSRPYRPRPRLNTALGALSGFILGGVYAFISEKRERRIRTPEAAVQYLRLPELGVIPSGQAELSRASRALPKLGDGEGGPVLAALHHAPSHLADSFRAAVASILFTAVNQNGARVIAVTSAAPKEGKTLAVSNLAVVLAQMKRRVLVIDGDIRKPRQHTVFGVQRDGGLTELLNGSASPQTVALTNYIKRTAVPGLSIITSGLSSAPFAEILNGARIEALIDQLRADFDVVLIDSPPVLAIADARILARYADGVVLVYRVSTTPAEAARMAARRLQSDGSLVLGTILNDLPLDRYKAYNYGYYSRNGSKASAPGS